MITCEEHDNCVVVFDGQDCPLCKVQDVVEEQQGEIEDLRAELKDLEEEEPQSPPESE